MADLFQSWELLVALALAAPLLFALASALRRAGRKVDAILAEELAPRPTDCPPPIPGRAEAETKAPR